jgi:tetratricopeptide (TPR) repeat protein
VWLTRLEREHDNCRAALAWARDRGEMATGLRLATRLARFWRARGYLSEGRTWLEGLLGGASLAQPSAMEAARLPPGVTMAVWARAVNAAGWLALWQRDDGWAAQWLEMAALTARAAGDLRTAADALCGLGLLALQRRDLGQAAARLEESLRLAREADSSSDIVQAALRDRGWVAYYQGDLARATACFEEGFPLVRQLGDHWGEAIWQVTLGELALRAGDLTQAVIREREALKQFLTLGTSVDVPIALELLALAAGGVGKKARAARLLGAAASVRVVVGAPLAAADHEDIEREMAAGRAALGEEAWAAAYAVGRALSLEEAVAEAVDEDRGAHDADL